MAHDESLKSAIEIAKRDNAYNSFQYNSRVSPALKYCCMTIPKVACSTIKITLHQLEGGEAPEDLGKIHEEGQRLADFTTDNLVDILNSPEWFRFCFVRNPYYRLFSAYKSKICNTWEKQYVWLQDEVRAQFDYPLREGKPAGMIAFRDFVRYLETAPQRARHDGHLCGQADALLLDLIEYEFIGRFEDFSTGMSHVLNRLKAPEAIHSVAAEIRNPTVKIWHAFAYDRELADRVFRMYESDFTTFGYDRDSWMFDYE